MPTPAQPPAEQSGSQFVPWCAQPATNLLQQRQLLLHRRRIRGLLSHGLRHSLLTSLCKLLFSSRGGHPRLLCRGLRGLRLLLGSPCMVT